MTLLTTAQRQQLINAAPDTHADHVTSLDSGVYAVVRVDGLGRRIVAMGTTAAQAIEKAKPAAPPTAPDAAAASRRTSRCGRAAGEKRKIDAEAFAAELAEYRRAAAAAGIETPELL